MKKEALPCPIAEARIIGPFENKFFFLIGGVSGGDGKIIYRDTVAKFYKNKVEEMKPLKKLTTPRVSCKLFTDWRSNNIFIFGGTEDPSFEIYKGKNFEEVRSKLIGKMVNDFYAQLCNHTKEIDLVNFSSA